MPLYLTVKEAAELLRIAEPTLRNKMNRGVFQRGKHYFRHKGQLGVRFKYDALIAWLEGEENQKKELKDKNIIPMARGYNLGSGR